MDLCLVFCWAFWHQLNPSVQILQQKDQLAVAVQGIKEWDYDLENKLKGKKLFTGCWFPLFRLIRVRLCSN